jgi:hypothetical protein
MYISNHYVILLHLKDTIHHHIMGYNGQHTRYWYFNFLVTSSESQNYWKKCKIKYNNLLIGNVRVVCNDTLHVMMYGILQMQEYNILLPRCFFSSKTAYNIFQLISTKRRNQIEYSLKTAKLTNEVKNKKIPVRTVLKSKTHTIHHHIMGYNGRHTWYWYFNFLVAFSE